MTWLRQSSGTATTNGVRYPCRPGFRRDHLRWSFLVFSAVTLISCDKKRADHLSAEKGTAGSCSVDASGAPPQRSYVVLVDRSDGIQDEEGHACDTVAQLVRSIVDASDEGFILQVFATGTKDSIGVVPLGETASVPPTSKAPIEPTEKDATMEKPFATLRKKYEAEKAEYECRLEAVRRRKLQVVDTASTACRKLATPVSYSPIYAALRSGLDECSKTPDVPCHVVFVTDLQETAEPSVCAAIFGRGAYGRKGGCPVRSGAELGQLPSPIDARRARITACGLTQSRDAGRRLGADVVTRIKTVWTKLVGNASEFQMHETCANLSLGR